MKVSLEERPAKYFRYFIALVAIASVFGAAIGRTGSSKVSPEAGAQFDANAMPIDLDRGAAGLARCLAAIRTRASILMVTAHPDDEDGGMLAGQSRGLGARASLLTLTRGEGGQNAMTTDFYDALGLERTQELLQSDRYYGVSQYWGRVIDYGFSKTREEALEKWGYERVLSDAVRVVRMTRPLIVTSVFVGAPTDGHGNHQVAGQMAQEVYLAAGDPTRFPEQIREGLRPWKPLKVFARVPFFAPTKEKTIYDYATDKYLPLRFYDYVNKTWMDKTPATDVTVPEGVNYAPTGLTFLQMSREGWGYQKTQNGGATLPQPSSYSVPYHLYGSRVQAPHQESSFYGGIDISLKGIESLATGGDAAFLNEGLAKLSKCAQAATDNYRPTDPTALAPLLADGLQLTRGLLEQVRTSQLTEPGKSDIAFELNVKQEQFEKALSMALGISFDAAIAPDKEPSGPFARFAGAQPTFTTAIPGQSFAIQTTLFNGSPEPIEIEDVRVENSDGQTWKIGVEKKGASGSGSNPADGSASKLAAGSEIKQRFAVTAAANATLTRPYFTRPNQEQPYYDLTDERFRNLSTSPYPLWAGAELSFHGVEFAMRRIVQANRHVMGVGMQQEPMLMAPAISVSVSPSAGAVPLTTVSFTFNCSLQNNVKGPANGMLRLSLPSGWQATPAEHPFAFTRDGETEMLTFQVTPQSIGQKQYEIRAVAEYNNRKYAEGYRLVGYPGLRPYPYYRPAVYQATGVDVKTAPGLRVAFVPGTGDELPQALRDLGLQPQILSGGDLATASLDSFDAIILGVRAYSAHPDLGGASKQLLEYVKKGGVLIVQYNLQNLGDNDGPYPFTLGSNAQKVVDENSRVMFLDPSNPALNWPNKITSADFTNWEEERGHGFMTKWDSHYQALFETHDPGQDPQRGGLLLARYGRGFYIYDAFALYRQLPSGVPGAYRILANLVSLGKNGASH